MKKMMTALTNLIMWTYYGLILLYLRLFLLFCPFTSKYFFENQNSRKNAFLAELLSPETVKLYLGTVP